MNTLTQSSVDVYTSSLVGSQECDSLSDTENPQVPGAVSLNLKQAIEMLLHEKIILPNAEVKAGVNSPEKIEQYGRVPVHLDIPLNSHDNDDAQTRLDSIEKLSGKQRAEVLSALQSMVSHCIAETKDSEVTMCYELDLSQG